MSLNLSAKPSLQLTALAERPQLHTNNHRKLASKKSQSQNFHGHAPWLLGGVQRLKQCVSIEVVELKD